MPVSTNNPRQLASGNWQYRYRKPDGSEGSVTRETAEEATKAGEATEAEIEAEQFIDPGAGRMPFAELWWRWLRSKRVIKQSSRTRYESAYRHWIERQLPGFRVPIADMPIRSVDEDVAADLIEAMQAAGRATSTIHNTLNPIRAALDYAVAREWLRKNPLQDLELPVKVVSVAPPPTDEEVERLLVALGRPTKTGRSRQWTVDFCVGLVELGGRFSEVAGLRVEDVTLHREQRAVGADVTGHARIHRQLDDETTKRRKTVIVPVSERLYGVLERLCEGRQPGDLVFTTPTGKGITNSRWHRDVWPQAVAAAGLHPGLRPHDCRHAFGTKLANTPGVSITTVKQLMGHSDIRTTMGYVHVAEDHLIDAIRKAEAHSVVRAQQRGNGVQSGPNPEPDPGFGATPAAGDAIVPSL